ncbi:MAG TPA: PD-(D/E)XK nuclease family protein [Bryobacteraceae bacterium]|nr:PD-(D/E)XK nuclease family protein [Bryobacteraceae bacterium]
MGLENKIDAAEQPNQITDYMAHLRTIAGENWFFVFLTRSGDNPKDAKGPNGRRSEMDEES